MVTEAYIDFICIISALKVEEKPWLMQIGKLGHVVDPKLRELGVLGVYSIYLCHNLRNRCIT